MGFFFLVNIFQIASQNTLLHYEISLGFTKLFSDIYVLE